MGKGVQFLEALLRTWGANLRTRYAPKFALSALHTILQRPTLTGHSPRWPTLPGANRKPCKPCFLVGRWRNAALSPPALVFGQEGPLSPGACMRAPTITIGGDHHHRHNHHGWVAAVTMVMVVMVGAYCLHRRARRYATGSATVTPCRAPASMTGCLADRAVHARHRYGRGARRRTRGRGSASAAKRASRAD